jgi:hypothetical protein
MKNEPLRLAARDTTAKSLRWTGSLPFRIFAFQRLPYNNFDHGDS